VKTLSGFAGEYADTVDVLPLVGMTSLLLPVHGGQRGAPLVTADR
jgi:hypothetical protein